MIARCWPLSHPTTASVEPSSSAAAAEAAVTTVADAAAAAAAKASSFAFVAEATKTYEKLPSLADTSSSSATALTKNRSIQRRSSCEEYCHDVGPEYAAVSVETVSFDRKAATKRNLNLLQRAST